jgi:quercetin dioxygenase-like cupin family protein
MNYLLKSVLIVSAACLLVSAQAAQETAKDEMHVSVPDEMQWKDIASLPPGAKLAVLHGDPTKPGTFTMRLRFPGGYQIPPHTHPADENVTVISGRFYIGHGERFDKSAVREIPEGGYVSMPTNMTHFAYVDDDTEVQLHGQGPWGIKYVNPADDPRNKE